MVGVVGYGDIIWWCRAGAAWWGQAAATIWCFHPASQGRGRVGRTHTQDNQTLATGFQHIQGLGYTKRIIYSDRKCQDFWHRPL